MVFFTDSPTKDASDYMSLPDEPMPEYTCLTCNETFTSGEGFKVEDDLFCKACHNGKNHIHLYMRVLDLDKNFTRNYLKDLKPV